MAYRHQKFIFKIFLFLTALLNAPIVNAQTSAPQQVLASNHILNIKVNAFKDFISKPDSANYIATPAPVTLKMKSAREKRKLMAYLKELNVPDDLDHYQSHQKLYYHLANVFARLKLYPLAMKCFLKSQVNYQPINSIVPDTLLPADTTMPNVDYLSAKDDSVVNNQAIITNSQPVEKASKNIGFERICSAFNDGKMAVAYAMLFHVKQPVPGKRKIFHWVNTGHTFITLIKYNSDSTFVSASFGFYPQKDQLLSATPLDPSTSSTFKDDANHKWDEVLGKFISRRRFDKILSLTRDYAGMEYHLNNNNCTDFGINAATIAGIKITETSGKWPLGSGNNPAVTGQSILLGKFSNIGQGNFNGLFMDSTVTINK